MKFVCIVVIVCAAIGLSQQAMSKEQMEDYLYKVMQGCANKEGANKKDIGVIAGRNPPENTVQKCLSACIGENLGLIKDGQTDVAMTTELAKTAFGDDDPKVAISTKVAEDCHEVTDPNRCEAAGKLYECSINAAAKYGVKFEDLL